MTIKTYPTGATAALTVSGEAELGDVVVDNNGSLTVNSGAEVAMNNLTVKASDSGATAAASLDGTNTIAGTTSVASGTLTLNGENTFVGQTTIGSKATLSLSGSNTFRSDVTVASDVTALTFNAGSKNTFEAAFNLNKTATIADGENTFNNVNIAKDVTMTVTQGDVEINGALQLADATSSTYVQNGGTLTTGYSNIVKSALSDDMTADDLVKNISLTLDELTLNGNNSYTLDQYQALAGILSDVETLHIGGTFTGPDATFANVENVGGDVEHSLVSHKVAKADTTGVITLAPTTEANITLGGIAITQEEPKTEITDITIGATGHAVTLRGTEDGTLLDLTGMTQPAKKDFHTTFDNVTLGAAEGDHGA